MRSTYREEDWALLSINTEEDWPIINDDYDPLSEFAGV